MTVSGPFNPTHIVRSFLEHEYAFEIHYPTHSVRIAHNKGTWFLVRVKEGRADDFIEIRDCFGGAECKNDLTLSLYTFFEQKQFAKGCDDPRNRYEESIIIDQFLRIWGGPYEKAESIAVYQPGRNSYVDDVRLEIELYPREAEFHD